MNGVNAVARGQLPMKRLRSVAELRVVCLARGLPAGLMTKFLVEAGAQVTVIDPPEGDPFAGVYAAHPVWFSGVTRASEADLEALLAEADVCLVGGEDHPDLATRWEAERLVAGRPRLVVVDVRALEPGRPEDVPAVEVLVQAAMGLTGEHRTSGPMLASMYPGGYGAALLGLLGAFTALVDRERSGRGQIVTTSWEQGIALTWSQLWMDSDPHDPAFDVVAPLDLQHLILQCRDGQYVQFTYGIPGAVRKVYDILGIETDVSEDDVGAPRSDRGPRNYYGMYDELAPGVARFDRDDLLERLREAGIPAEPVLAPGECWDHPQIRVNGFVVDGPLGRHVGPTVVHRAPPPAQPPPASANDVPQQDGAPLRGLRVLDFGTLVAGPYASTLLTRLGATVTKVESASRRASGATVRNNFAVSTGKQSLCLDLKAPKGAEVLSHLCEHADVVQHNYRVGVADRLGLDPASLWRTDPQMMTLTTTAFGPEGPKVFDSGLDMVVAALTGLQVRAGAGEPSWYRAPAIDYVCGALGAIGIVMSYLERLRYGEAPAIETSLLGAALFLQQDLVEQDGELDGLPGLSPDGLGTSTWERLYECADGWVAFAARSEKQRAGLMAVAGLSGSAEDDTGLATALANALRGRTTADVLTACEAHDVWATACAGDAWERLRSGYEQGVSRMVGEVDDAEYGRVASCFGQLVEFSRWSGPVLPGVGLARRGEHTRLLLTEAGYSEAEIARLYEEGVVA